MYSHNDDFNPPSPETTLWRYMDFSKFVSFLHNRGLWFSRLDLLSKQDPYEGSPTRAEAINIELNARASNRLMPKYDWRTGIQGMRTIMQISTFVNCWHSNTEESLAMWKIYTNSNYGIAIKTNFERLTKSIIDQDFAVSAGTVKYVNYTEYNAVIAKPLYMDALRKSLFYEYEKEVRLLYRDLERERLLFQDTKYSIDKYEDLAGYFIKIDLDNLINEIYVDPKAEPWFEELINNVCDIYKDKFLLNNRPRIIRSKIFLNNIDVSVSEDDIKKRRKELEEIIAQDFLDKMR